VGSGVAPATAQGQVVLFEEIIQPIKYNLLHKAQVIDLTMGIRTIGCGENAKFFRTFECIVKLASLSHLLF
jgi:hypothetical protein